MISSTGHEVFRVRPRWSVDSTFLLSEAEGLSVIPTGHILSIHPLVDIRVVSILG